MREHFEITVISHTDTEITFKVPSPAPWTGEGYLWIFIGVDGAERAIVGGAETCSADLRTGACKHDRDLSLRRYPITLVGDEVWVDLL